MRQTRKSQGMKTYDKCTDGEKSAVERWYRNGHPSNHPDDKATALWSFRVVKGALHAELNIGGIL